MVLVAKSRCCIDTEGPQAPQLSSLGLKSFEDEYSNDQFMKFMKSLQWIMSRDRLQDGEPFTLNIISHFALIVLRRKSSPHYSVT